MGDPHPSHHRSLTGSGTPAATTQDESAFIVDALQSEAEAIAQVARGVETSERQTWRAAVDLLDSCRGHVVVAGMGKSGLIGAKISATFSSLGVPSNALHPAEAVHGDYGRVRRGDVVILLSFSGETEEVVNLAALLKADDVPRLGISSRPESSLARLSTVHICVGDITEACPLNLAPTASTTATLAIGDALALALSRRRNFSSDDFQRKHPGGMLGVGLRPVTEVLRFRVGESLAVVRDTATVREAVDQAGRVTSNLRRTGAVVLVDDQGRLSGIYTDADLRRDVLESAQTLDRPIADVMTRRPEHLVVDDLVRDAVRLMRENRHDEIPVVDHDGRPVGLVDVQDLIALKVVVE
jgi:arabinose-5-phosphate isomerase